ncbi:MAG: class I SAM-dependent methyltransferase [Gammaproteobacteria bacterium TMED104]|nr:MAG: class I SAM-dependent methyltransferase [Gammaproteobacteria bacterium TMED104]|tara:strand:- start:12136 stop:13317 length:1182 start_codon:yes stop_codon:yes gene_type:complete
MEMVMLNQIIKNWINKKLKTFEDGSLRLSIPGCSDIIIGDHNQPQFNITFTSIRGIYLILRRGVLGFTEGFIQGYWITDNLQKTMTFLAKNLSNVESIKKGNSRKFITKFQHWLRENTLSRSKKNIHAHYDLGNAFYELWLDSSMTYSSAIFQNLKEEPLESAQKNKYQKIIDSLNLKPGDNILEIGCGWGGFIEHASKLGINVTGLTISKEQFEYASSRITNLGGTQKILYEDYRVHEGLYDAVVSIEMLEAVGSKYWNEYFDSIKRFLKPGSSALVQVITMHDEYFKTYNVDPDFIQTYIFPGGELISDEAFFNCASTISLECKKVRSFGDSYAKTLELWNEQFQKRWNSVRELGFDIKFKRTWEMYYAYCIGGFLSDRLDVTQFKLTCND